MPVHLHAEQPASTAEGRSSPQLAFAPVAEHTGVDGERVDDRVGDLIIAPTVKVAHTGPGPCARAGRSAVSGKAADARFQMDGDKIRHDERAVEATPRSLSARARVDNDGQRSRHALIAAARVDDNRLFAAVHARVRARGSPALARFCTLSP